MQCSAVNDVVWYAVVWCTVVSSSVEKFNVLQIEHVDFKSFFSLYM